EAPAAPSAARRGRTCRAFAAITLHCAPSMPSARPTTDPGALAALIAEASARRKRVRTETTAYRLLDGGADGLAGVAVDIYDAWSVVSIYDEAAELVVEPLASQLVAS